MEIREKFIAACSDLKYVCDIEEDRQIILYGAGNEGLKALGKYRGRVSYFADGNTEKEGKLIEGIRVISVAEMIEKSKDYQIVISVGGLLMYELMENLISYGVNKFSLYF
jgi:FlaA1/EpsC-like NDP-sugar epimerase